MEIADPYNREEESGQTWLRRDLVAPWWEITLVVAVTIGLPAGKSTWAAFHGSSSNFIAPLLRDRSLIHYIAIESGMLALLFGFFYLRGWTRADLKIKPGWRHTVEGILLAPAMMFSNSVIVACGIAVAYAWQTKFGAFLPFLAAQVQHLPHSIELHWSVLIAAMVLNAFFEEITCMGYAFTQLAAKRGPGFALVVIVLLRMSCHSYQGLIHMLGIGAVFLLAGLMYLRTRALWPLIVAHAIIDIASMSLVKVLHP